MYLYKGKEYKSLDYIKAIVNTEVLQLPEVLLADAEWTRLLKERDDALNLYNMKQKHSTASKTRKDNLIIQRTSQLMQTVSNVTYDFKPIGFFASGEVVSMNEEDNTILIQPSGSNVAFSYNMIKTGNTIITKPRPLIKYKHHTGSMIELYPIGYNNEYAIAFGSTDPIVFNCSDSLRQWYQLRRTVKEKIDIIKSSVFPSESDKIEIMKWVMKQQNK